VAGTFRLALKRFEDLRNGTRSRICSRRISLRHPQQLWRRRLQPSNRLWDVGDTFFTRWRRDSRRDVLSQLILRYERSNPRLIGFRLSDILLPRTVISGIASKHDKDIHELEIELYRLLLFSGLLSLFGLRCKNTGVLLQLLVFLGVQITKPPVIADAEE